MNKKVMIDIDREMHIKQICDDRSRRVLEAVASGLPFDKRVDDLLFASNVASNFEKIRRTGGR